MTGSLVNNILSNCVAGQPTPTVGMGVTLLGYTDRTPATVIEVTKGGKFICVQNDNWVRTDTNGMSDCQSYSYSANPEGCRNHFRLGKDNRWQQVYFNTDTQRWNKASSYKLRLGVRERYYDFSF